MTKRIRTVFRASFEFGCFFYLQGGLIVAYDNRFVWRQYTEKISSF